MSGATSLENQLQFDKNGLVPVVVQDHLTGEIRMVAYATLEAIRATLQTGRATFWSRSRGELWEKGRTSGNAIAVRRVLVDCDSDCLIYAAEPTGPSCHTGAPSCFFQAIDASAVDGAIGGEARAPIKQKTEQPQTVLATVEALLESRKHATGATSYTKSLYDGGAKAIGAKIEEEAAELARAIADESEARVVAEAADLVYHALVGLRSRGIPFRDVLAALDARLGVSGHAEKNARSPKTK